MLDIKPYSSNIKLTLSIAGLELDVAQLARDYLILRDKVSVDATEGVLTIMVDNEVRKKPIIISRGISAETERTRYW